MPAVGGSRSARHAAHTDHGRVTRRLPLPTPAAGTAACRAARTLRASPRSGLTPRPPQCPSSSQAVSPSVRALVAPELLDSEPNVTPPRSFARLPTLPRACLPKLDRELAATSQYEKE